MQDRGLALTQVGMCCNPSCRAPLYAELMLFADDEACFDCVPHDSVEGWHPVVATAFGGADALRRQMARERARLRRQDEEAA